MFVKYASIFEVDQIHNPKAEQDVTETVTITNNEYQMLLKNNEDLNRLLQKKKAEKEYRLTIDPDFTTYVSPITYR